MQKGYFITFEGLDSCGKSTQISLVESYLREMRAKVIKTQEPGGTHLGKFLRQTILSEKFFAKKYSFEDIYISPTAELLLYAAARAEHVSKVIRPNLEKNYIVLCDRYIDSTYAYQGYVRNLEMGIIEKINKVAMDGVYPDFTFFIDISVEEARKRLQQRELDKMEKDFFQLFEKLRFAYKKLAENEPNRIITINGEMPRRKVFEDIRKNINERIRLK